MIQLSHGDRLPIVAAAQLLLNSRLPGRTPLVADGIYGNRTQSAVEQFCRTEARGLRATEGVGPEIWSELVRHTRFSVRDIIDTADPVLHESRERLELAGGMPILFGAGSNATAWIAPSVAGSGVAAGRLVLLRFHGHGNQGSQVVGYGTTVHILFDVLRREPVPDLHSVGSREEVGITAEEDALMGLAASRSRISVASLDLPEVEVAMRQLRPLFAPCGSIELHGCRVGGGADGRRLLRKLADIVGVPVSAAIERQTTGNAIRFRPPILTVCPGGVSLRQWGTSQPVINRSLA